MSTSASPWLRGKRLLSLCFVAAFCIITVMSTCSFLYPTNTWGDAQCFYTVGKSIAHGKVLYRDIYEQKGPLLYFLHACVEWLPLESANPFLEIYILQVFCATAVLFFLMKILTLYLGERRRVLVCLPLLCVLVYCNRAYSLGDSAEEFSLVMAAYVLYATLRMLRSETHELSRRSLFAIGVLCGCVLWIKYTCLSFAVGALIVPLCVVIRERNWRLLGRAAAFVSLGVLVASIPVLVYFAVHHAFDALWEVYFYNNIFGYSENAAISGGRVYYTAARLYYHGKRCYGPLLFALGGWVYAVCQRWKLEAWHLPCIVVAIAAVIAASGRIFVYSLLPFMVLSVMGLVGLGGVLGHLRPARGMAALAVTTAVCIGLFSYPVWRRPIGRPREDVPAYRIVSAMERDDDTTLLDVGFLDNGFYTAGDFLPQTRYFCRLNLVTPEMVEEWRRIVREGAVDYIYTGDRTLNAFCPPEEQAPYVLVSGEESDQRLYKLERPEDM